MTDKIKQELWNEIQKYGQDALAWNHYELASKTAINNPVVWKSFLQQPDVIEWIESENDLIQSAELRRLIQNIGKNKSTAQSQALSVLLKATEGQDSKADGPIFIYTYVPLNPEQEAAINVHKLDKDPFIKEPS